MSHKTTKKKSPSLKFVSPQTVIGAFKTEKNVIIVNVLNLPYKIDCKNSKTITNYSREEFESFLSTHNNQIPNGMIVIIYCASWSCSASHTYYKSLVKKLKSGISRVYDYNGGLLEWSLLSLSEGNLYRILKDDKVCSKTTLQKIKNDMLHSYLIKKEVKDKKIQKITRLGKKK